MQMVDLTNLFSWTILVHLARHLIMFNIVHAMLKSKYNTAVTFFGIVGVGLVYSYFSLLNTGETLNEIIMYVLFIALELAVAVLTCRGSFLSKVMSVLLGVVFIFLPNMIISPLLIALGFPSKYFVSFETPLILVLTISLFGFSLSFLGAFIIKLIQNRSLKKNGKHTNKAYILLLIPLIHMFLFLAFESALRLSIESSSNDVVIARLSNFSLAVSFICFFIDAFILFLVDYIDKLEYRNIKNEKQILSNAMTYQQTLLLNEEKKEFRKMNHDINNIISTSVGFIELGKTDKALEILKQTGVSFSTLGGTSVCSNDLLNTVFYIKSQAAKNYGVDFSVSVTENSAIKINDYDLCRVLNNLIDNSLNAANTAESAKKSEIEVTVESSCISIVTRNTFDSIKPKKVRDIRHGYGVGIIKDIIKKYNGNYIAKTENEVYITETVIDNISLKSL